jgi:hypothetical protein
VPFFLIQRAYTGGLMLELSSALAFHLPPNLNCEPVLVKVEPRAVYVSFRVFASAVEGFMRVPVLYGVSVGIYYATSIAC